MNNNENNIMNEFNNFLKNSNFIGENSYEDMKNI